MDRAGLSNDGSSGPVPDRPRLVTAARDPRQGSEARRLLIERLTEWGCDRIDDVAVAFSELVTNAVLHGGGAVRISACPTDDGCHVHLQVHDRVRAAPVPCPGGPDGGFGLHIIDRLSEGWGATPTAGGKVVWALIRADCGGPGPWSPGGG